MKRRHGRRPLFEGHSRSIPQGMIFNVQPLVQLLFCPIRKEKNNTHNHITLFFFFRHGGPPPKALHQGGLSMGNVCVHGEPKFSEGQPRVFTDLIRVKNTA